MELDSVTGVSVGELAGVFPSKPASTLDMEATVTNQSLKPLDPSRLEMTVRTTDGSPLSCKGITVPAPIPPGATVRLPFSIAVSPEAPLMSSHQAIVTLALDGVQLQGWPLRVRVGADYEPPKSPEAAADVLLFVPAHFDICEFDAWRRMLTGIGLSYDIWDVSNAGGITKDVRTGAPIAKSWIGRHPGRLLLYPAADPAHASLLEPGAIVQHLRTPAPGDAGAGSAAGAGAGAGADPSLASLHAMQQPGVVVLGCDPVAFDTAMFNVSFAEGRAKSFGPDDFTAFHMPGTNHKKAHLRQVYDKRDSLIADMEKESPAYRHGVVGLTVNIKDKSPVEFSFGKLELAPFPVPRGARLAVLPHFLTYRPIAERPEYDPKVRGCFAVLVLRPPLWRL